MNYEPVTNEDIKTALMNNCKGMIDALFANPTVGFAKAQNDDFEVIILRLK